MVSWLLPSVMACLVGTVILLFIYTFLCLKYGKSYLGLWALALFFHSVRFLSMRHIITSGPLDMLLIANQEATLASTLLILAGIYRFANKKLPVSWVLLGCLAGGWTWVAQMFDMSFVTLTLPPFLFMCACQIWSGIMLLQMSELSLLSRWVPGVTLIIWGLFRLGYPFLRGIEEFAPWGYAITATCAFLVAVSLLLGYFEKFRNDVLRKDQLFRSTFDQAALGLAHVSGSWCWLRLNKRFSEILDRAPEDVFGVEVRMYVHPDDMQLLDGMLSAARTGTSADSREIRLVRRNGQTVWTNLTVSYIPGDGDTSGYFVVTAEDISRRKAVENRLRESEAKYRLLVDNVSVGVCVAGDEHLLFVNPVMERLTERSGAELLGRPFVEFIHPEDRKKVREYHLRRIRGEEIPESYTFRMLDARGRVRNVEISSVLFDWNGRPATLNFVTDITERVVQEERNRSIARFPEENPSPVMRLDSRGGPVYTNPAAREFFHLDDEQRVLPDGLLSAAALALSSGHIRSVDVALADSTYQFLLVPLVETSETNVYGMDVSARVRVERELKRARDKAQLASRAKSEFLANISHEIRTPINGVVGMLQLLQEMGMNPQQKEYVNMALESGQSLMTILNDLLQLATADTVGAQLESQPLNMSEQLKVVSGVFLHNVREKELKLEMECDSSVPQWVLGDSGRIRQVLFNLVGNSVKFSSHGTVRVWASLLRHERDKERTLLMCVSDQGPGIPDEEILTAFEPFTQVDSSSVRRFGGVGLGLGIVRKLVTAMGGTICVDSTMGQGTDIYVTLKVKSMGKGRTDVVPTDVEDIPSLRILLVEDERISRLGTVQYLKSHGFTVHTAGNGVEALDSLAAHAFDCVLMDIQMPLLDGISAVKKLRAGDVGELNRHVPVVALTAHVLQGDVEYLKAGMDAYLSKPVVFEEMVSLVEELAGAEA